MPPNEMVPQCHWCAGRCCSFGCVLAHDNVCRAKPEGGEVDQVDGQQTLAGIGRSKQEQDQELPPAKGWKKYDTTYWEQEGCNLHLDLDDAHALAAEGLREDGSNRSESFLDARRGAYWSRKRSAPWPGAGGSPGEGGERGRQTDTPRPVNLPNEFGSLSARGDLTQGVASFSSDVDARADGFG